jgi:hypothetical protein
MQPDRYGEANWHMFVANAPKTSNQIACYALKICCAEIGVLKSDPW